MVLALEVVQLDFTQATICAMLAMLSAKNAPVDPQSALHAKMEATYLEIHAKRAAQSKATSLTTGTTNVSSANIRAKHVTDRLLIAHLASKRRLTRYSSWVSVFRIVLVYKLWR